MTDTDWRALDATLKAALGEGRDPPVRFWLRDDDAVAVTPALQRLGALADRCGAPLLLAVIPAGAVPALAGWCNDRPLVTPCQHGYAHANHAGAGERACELGGERDDAAVLRDLAAGYAAMAALFAASWTPILVPPWNRIRPSLLPHLAPRGYAALSTFAGPAPRENASVPILDSDIDIIDWRNGRRGRTGEDICRRVVSAITAARPGGAPIGILTHHLAHDDTAWAVLDQLLSRLRDHPAASFVSAGSLLALDQDG